MSIRTLAAGLSTPMDFKIVAPSLVTSTFPSSLPSQRRILSMPFGPKVDLTRSPMAIAPMKEERRADSALSSSASARRTRTGFNDTGMILIFEIYSLIQSAACRNWRSSKLVVQEIESRLRTTRRPCGANENAEERSAIWPCLVYCISIDAIKNVMKYASF